MTQYPEIVVEYIEYGIDSKFDLLKLEVDIDSTTPKAEHGNMTALVRYQPPFLLDGSPIIIIFGLRDDVSLFILFGLSMMLLLRTPLDCSVGTIVCPVIGEIFLDYGMSSGVRFDKDTFIVKLAVESNIPSNNVVINHVTTNDNISFVHDPTLSNNLIVRYLWFSGTFSQTLELLQPK